MSKSISPFHRFCRRLAGATSAIALTASAAPAVAGSAASSSVSDSRAWMSPEIVKKQTAAEDDVTQEAIARQRARSLLASMTLDQKLQQLTGSRPEILSELPDCFGARHVSGIISLAIPTFRIANGPVGVGQNDCVSRNVYESIKDSASPYASYVAYTHPTSAKATALPSAMSVAASFDPQVANLFGEVIATEMNNLALHVFEAPGVNLARLPILGRNFEYFGEDPYLSGTIAVAEVKAVQSHGLIAMAKHFIANEQETNRQTIQETVDLQTLRELYLLPFEMVVKDAKIGAIMCAYNYVNGLSSCENKVMLTDVLRTDWKFTGYVQSDFFAMKSTVPALKAGMDHEMPLPQYWAASKLKASLAVGDIGPRDIDTALERRYTQMFRAGIFDRPLAQTPIDFAAGSEKARRIGGEGAVLLQNNGALPIAATVKSLVLVGKASQVYAQQAVAGGAMTGHPLGAGGGSSDVVPYQTISPLEGLKAALKQVGNSQAPVSLILVDDDNATATIDGKEASFESALHQMSAADAVIIMAGTISEEGADRAAFEQANGRVLAGSAAAGSGLDWYADKPNVIATLDSKANLAKNSHTVEMIKAILRAPSTTPKVMSVKTALVLKDNAGIALDAELIGRNGPAILEVWFPGQEDGHIVSDVLFGLTDPAGKLPVTFPIAGKSFLDSITPEQFPGIVNAKTNEQTVRYTEGLNIGYRWYDANVSGGCKITGGANPCVAFPFGHGLSYTHFSVEKPRLSLDKRSGIYTVRVKVTNTGARPGAEVIQTYVSLPPAASERAAVQPPRRLVGFTKVKLAPGRSARVEISIDPSASNHPFSVWSEAANAWVKTTGVHTIWVGKSSALGDLSNAGAAQF